MEQRKWTEEENNILIQNHDLLSIIEISKILNRTKSSVSYRIKRLGLKSSKTSSIKWTDEEKALIKEMKLNRFSLSEIADKVNSTITAVASCIKTYGLNPRHYLSSNPLYDIWVAMKCRCNGQNKEIFKNYGGRGITFCDDWKNFLPFYDWAINNGYEAGLSIDRIDVNGNYCPENCRWATIKQQSNNKRNNLYLSAFGETKTASEWIEDSRCKSSRQMLYYRIKNGWNAEKAITTPTKNKC